MLRHGPRGSCLIAAALFTAATASSQERDPAAAQALFDQGRSLMKSQRYAEACPKLAESQRLDPGVGTQFHLADCYERSGKIASAWAIFLEVASLSAAAGQDDRSAAARKRAARLEGRLPRLRIVVPQENRVPGLEISRDGAAVGEAQWETPLPVDPGEHQVRVSAPRRRAFLGTVSVQEGTTASLEVPPLEALPEDPSAPPAPIPVDSTSSTDSRSAPLQPPPPDPMRDAGGRESSGPGGLVIALGAVGVVGLGAGTVLGLMASSKNSESKDHCPRDENSCTAEGVDLRDDAFLFANLATAGFIVGGAALVGAGIVWLGSSDSKSAGLAAPSLRTGIQAGPERTTLLVQGRF